MKNIQSADTAEFPALDDPQAKHFGPIPPPVHVEFGALSHPGLVRAHNEDHYVVIKRQRTRSVLLTNVPEGLLPPADDTSYVMGVADGIGGSEFGELASMLVIRSGWMQAPSTIKWTWIINDREIEEFKEKVELIFSRMDQALKDRAQAEPAFAGMGTTLTVAYTVGPEAFIAHAGDSRAYLFHEDVLTQLTRDHTLAQQCLDVGMPVPYRSWHHVLTNSLSATDRQVTVDFHHLRLSDGDQLLLCSDGLTDMVKDVEISRILAQGAPPEEAVRTLVELALHHGGKDNVTVVLGRYLLSERG
jgi:protein phosphatase